jgi:hypothetical protein
MSWTGVEDLKEELDGMDCCHPRPPGTWSKQEEQNGRAGCLYVTAASDRGRQLKSPYLSSIETEHASTEILGLSRGALPVLQKRRFISFL